MRIVALGASNLTLALPTLVSTARAAWGPDVEVMAALGHGRSYGLPSRVLVRTLPGILQSGLWPALERRPEAPTRALITDVGNDILYGCSPSQILAWVEECTDRLQRFTRDIVLTDLPLFGIRGLSRRKFLLVRSIVYPRCRLTLEQATRASEDVAAGLEALAEARAVRLCRLRPEWYGFDPIHIQRRRLPEAWPEILCGMGETAPTQPTTWLEAIRLLSVFPERQWLLGREQVTSQAGVRLRRGGRLWLY